MIGIEANTSNDSVTKTTSIKAKIGGNVQTEGRSLHNSPNVKSHTNQQPTEMDIESMQPNLTSSPRRQLSSVSSSGESIDWCTLMEEDDRRLHAVRKDMKRHKEKLIKYEKLGIPKDDRIFQVEEDEAVLVRRQKQIEYGRNTKCYTQYSNSVPKRMRKKGVHPSTPNKFQVCSRRSWDSQVRIWRRNLHEWNTGGKGNTKRMLSNDTWSDASSENDHTMDQGESSLDTSVTSSVSSGMTASNEGSRSASPLTIGQDNCKGTCDNKPIDNSQPPSYASVVSNNTPNKPTLALHIPTKNPKTPTGTPAENEVDLDPEMSPPPFNPTELVEALQKVGISPSQPDNQRRKNNRKSLANKFSEMSCPVVRDSASKSKEDMKDLEECWD